MKRAAFLLALALTGCAGGSTIANFKVDPATGAIEGNIIDGKDREGADLEITAKDFSVRFNSTGSSGSVASSRVLDTIDSLVVKIP